MKIIPVIDLKGGQVVRGIAGRREEYRPIVSKLTSSSMPGKVGKTFRDHFGFREAYIADLDAIGGEWPATAVYEELKSEGLELWVDAGCQDSHSLKPLLAAGVDWIVAGTETVAGMKAVIEMLRVVGPDRLIVSLDLRDGKPLVKDPEWSTQDPWSIVVDLIGAGLRRLLVLDLGRVGMNTGAGTDTLCQQIAVEYPLVELSAGGGVRCVDDLRRLREYGVENALVASALHDGRISPAALQDLG